MSERAGARRSSAGEGGRGKRGAGPARRFPYPARGALAGDFGRRATAARKCFLNLPEGDAAASLTLPSTAFFGLAVKPMENLELEADYQYVGWSSYDKLTIEFKKDPSKNSTADKKYENTYIIRVGGEYTMDAFQFRAGYLYDHSPVQPKYVDPMLPDAHRNGLNLGIGYKVTSNITVDLSYLNLAFDQAKAVGTDSGFDGTFTAGANLFGFNFGYTF